ncbi:molecular chaperone [Citrobacter sp. ku-bf4]|uniref:TorD/DmsD family molecular chaperone n=1 Tax=Citrobacter TaxID=544 RepID=UPI00198238D5|nr:MULTISPECIES: molecular chaperone [Citrobacter]MBN6042496.1 molecular chaperone [Citrobacter sp. ku-bf4]MBS0823872.1 molecular chaperone [Citrobacter amalonaticus]
MSSLAVLPRILGALFYYSPGRPEVKALFDCLPALPELYPWRDPARVTQLCESWPLPDEESLIWQFSVLFEGQGDMPAPPWGSVWLERDNLLMGDTTAAYRAFLQSQGMVFDSRQSEPEDQFGLMLLACSALQEAGNDAAVDQLFEVHLLPWGYRYLERVQESAVSPFYTRLAAVTACYLQESEQQRALQPAVKRLYFG